MRAVHLTAFGNPVDGLKYVDMPEPDAPGPNQVLIGVEFSPINPNDLNVARGTYAFRPPLPAVIGNEGVGRVLAVGSRVESVKVGDRVSCAAFQLHLEGADGCIGWRPFRLCLLTQTRGSWRCWA